MTDNTIIASRGYIDGRIAATITSPAGPAVAVIVVCAPFGIEALAAHSATRNLAAAFAERGVACIQFSAPGQGESADLRERPPACRSELLVDEWLAAADSVLTFARTSYSDIPLCAMGLRLGATVAATAAARHGGVDQLVLWATVSGRAFARELKMLGAAGHGTRSDIGGPGVEAGGFALCELDVAALQVLDAASLSVAPARRALVIDRDDVRSGPKVVDRLNSLGVQVDAPTLGGYAAMRLDDPELGTVPFATLAAIAAWVEQGTRSGDGPRAATSRSGEPAVSLCRTMRLDHLGAHVDEEPVDLELVDGDSLVGVISRPAFEADETLPAIVVLATGSNPACGPGRLNASLARRWAAAGHPVLRIERRERNVGHDHGLGDAYGDAQVADVAALARTVRTTLGRSTFVAVGTCSGAWVAFHAAHGSTTVGLSNDRATLVGIASLNQIIFNDDTWSTTEESPALAIKARYELAQTLRDPRRWGVILRGDVPVRPAVQRLARFVSMRTRAATALVRARLTGAEPDGVAAMIERIAAHGITQLYVMDAAETGLGYLRVHAPRQLAQLNERGSLRLCVAEGLGHTFGSRQAQRWLADTLDRELRTLGLRIGTPPIPTTPTKTGAATTRA